MLQKWKMMISRHSETKDFKTDSPFSIFAKLFNSKSFVKDQVRAGCPKLGHTTLNWIDVLQSPVPVEDWAAGDTEATVASFKQYLWSIIYMPSSLR